VGQAQVSLLHRHALEQLLDLRQVHRVSIQQLLDIHGQYADIRSAANGLPGMVAQKCPDLRLLLIGELELLREPFHMVAHHTARAHHASTAHHAALWGFFCVILLALGRHAPTLAAHHAVHPFHHALHLLGLRWCAGTRLGRWLLGCLGTTGMMLLMLLLLLSLDASAQYQTQHEGYTGQLARYVLHTCLLVYRTG
jgi:hypothetical protein